MVAQKNSPRYKELNVETVTVWKPQPKQALLISCPIFETLFGGSRGGGKSDAVLGEWAIHADQYGINAIGLCVRRERTQLVELIERSKVLYKPLGATFHEIDKMWRFPNGARLRFAFLENDSDAMNYQGHSYCVEENTKIKMADGALKKIKDIEVGEKVLTLLGPKKVLYKINSYLAPCIVTNVHRKFQSKYQVVGQRVAPVWHPVLTTAGVSSKHKNQILYKFQRFLSWLNGHCNTSFQFHRDTDRGNAAWFSFSKDGQNYHKAYQRLRQETQQLGSLFVPVVLHEPYLQLNVEQNSLPSVRKPILYYFLYKLFQLKLVKVPNLKYFYEGLRRKVSLFQQALDRFYLFQTNVLSYAQNERKIISNSQSYYDDVLYQYDQHVLFELKTYLNAPPLLNDVEAKFRLSPWGVLDTIPRHTHPAPQSWVHPYTGEEHYLLERVGQGMMEVVGVQYAWVSDLCIEDANHYISECGLIEANTRIYCEEMGTFPSFKPIRKLMATLRSGAGVPVRFIATANPGGPGHGWIKQRYIDPAPMGMKILYDKFPDSITGKTITAERVFIPSGVQDNKYTNNSGYIGRLYMSGNEELVKAWLFGDWNIISGAFFQEWDTKIHVIKTFTPPKNWTRFMSMDWGSASPFSIGWWCIVGEDHEISSDILEKDWRLFQSPNMVKDNKLLLPKNAIIRYKEWYGSKPNENNQKEGTNEGLKLTAEEIAEGVALREIDEPKNEHGKPRITYRVIDPAAFKEDGGPSVVERMGAHVHIYFNRADNARVSKNGAMGGWDQVRARLKGQDGRPMMYFMDNCVDAIRTLPALQHNEDKMEDVDTTGEDHAPDEIRYACMSRPYHRPTGVDLVRKLFKKNDNTSLVLHDILDDLPVDTPKSINLARVR